MFTFGPLFLKVLLYDLRSSQPLLVKDHFYNLPIKSLNFYNQLDLVVSADSKIIKFWNKDTVSFLTDFQNKFFVFKMASVK